MKITSIRAIQPPTPGSPPDWRTQLGQIVVEIRTDDGLRGIGVGGGGAAGIHIVETVLSDLLLGEEATAVEQLHAKMLDHTEFYGRSGLVVMAISGVDLALWDLRGKAAEQPIARLLNSEVDLQAALPTYVTVFGSTDTEDALLRGHRAVKLHVERFGHPPDVAAIASHVAEVRAALGQDGMLMLDAFARWDVKTSQHVAEAVERFNLAWLEEPLRPSDFSGYAYLRDHSPVAIAGGEHEYLASGFQNLIDHELHAVLQPDINWCGGMTTMIEIYQMAKTANVRVVPHRGVEPYALAAIAAFDPQPLAESPRKWFSCLKGVPQIEAGCVQVVDRPGFGVDFEWPI